MYRKTNKALSMYLLEGVAVISLLLLLVRVLAIDIGSTIKVCKQALGF
jgi:hypothetical protein